MYSLAINLLGTPPLPKSDILLMNRFLFGELLILISNCVD